MSELKQELKEKIIEQLNLEDVAVEEIQDTDPLFGEGLGLDSIDALELIVMLDKDYGIKLADPKQGRDRFSNRSRPWPDISRSTAVARTGTSWCRGHHRSFESNQVEKILSIEK